MLTTFRPSELWKIATWETTSSQDTFDYLSDMKVPLRQMFKPYLIYGGHHRLEFAKKHQLPLKAYIF